jgi:hypothetical protein
MEKTYYSKNTLEVVNEKYISSIFQIPLDDPDFIFKLKQLEIYPIQNVELPWGYEYDVNSEDLYEVISDVYAISKRKIKKIDILAKLSYDVIFNKNQLHYIMSQSETFEEFKSKIEFEYRQSYDIPPEDEESQYYTKPSTYEPQDPPSEEDLPSGWLNPR